MLTACLGVRYPDDWTTEIGALGVVGDIYTATLHKRHYIGLIRLYGGSTEIDEALELVHTAPYHTSVDVVQHDIRKGRASASIIVTAELTERTPLTVMLENGYLPLDPTTLRDGREYFDLLLRDRDRLVELVERLNSVGEVTIERVVDAVETPIQPRPAAWVTLLESLTDRQFAVLATAVEKGYFEVPRRATLDDVAAEFGLEKSTVSEHLRRGTQHIASFVIEETREGTQHSSVAQP